MVAESLGWRCKKCRGFISLQDGKFYEYVEKPFLPPMTNADRIRAMTDEELAELLSQTAYAGETPWCEPFNRKFCDNCPTVEGTIKETGKTMDFNECDFADGKCPHGSDIVWWLGQPAEVEHNDA